jgi:G protein beta subunit-like protein
LITYLLQQVNRLEITPDKRFLAAAGNSHIRLFDVNSNSPQPVCYMFSKTNQFGPTCFVPYLIKINLTGN